MVLPVEKKPTVAALKFITTGHFIRNIHSCLDIFVESLRKYSPSNWRMVDLIEIDFSKAMIQSACKAFNNFDLEMNLEKSFQELEHPEKD